MNKPVKIYHTLKDKSFKAHVFRCYFFEYYSILDIYDWCEENILYEWDRSENITIYGIYSPYFADIHISDDQDAMLFKLTWYQK